MKKILLALFLPVILTGCNSTVTLRSKELVVAFPDKELFKCPIIQSFPKSNTLTDVQVAKLIVTLYKNNMTCRYHIDAIFKYLKDAETSLPNQPK